MITQQTNLFGGTRLLHEAVITLPGRGGYGLPTARFALQAAGFFVDRAPMIGRRPWGVLKGVK